MIMERCTWKIRWAPGRDAECEREAHEPDVSHVGLTNANPDVLDQRVSWLAGDRREFQGIWPGPCTKTAGCTLHTGHHGRCAP